MPKVSVIIPVYNVEKYLRECLDSVVNQTLKDIEIICINDGSPDNSLAILEEYAKKDSRIIVISQENSGVSTARNVGIDLAKGDYLYFIDADDYAEPDLLELSYQKALSTQCDIVNFGFFEHYCNNLSFVFVLYIIILQTTPLWWITTRSQPLRLGLTRYNLRHVFGVLLCHRSPTKYPYYQHRLPLRQLCRKVYLQSSIHRRDR